MWCLTHWVTIATQVTPAHLKVAHQIDYLDYLVFYVAFNSQGHIATGSLQVEETSAYCTVNHQAWESNYQLSNMKHLA